MLSGGTATALSAFLNPVVLLGGAGISLYVVSQAEGPGTWRWNGDISLPSLQGGAEDRGWESMTGRCAQE